MVRASTTTEDEDLAARIVADSIGAVARRHDDGSSEGQHDFWLVRGGQNIAALEVTSYAREHAESLEQALGKHGRVIESDRLTLTWLLDVDGSTDVRSLINGKDRAERYLAMLEDQGIHTFVSAARTSSTAVILSLRRLGIVAGRGVPDASDPRRIILSGPPGVAGWTADDWVERAVATVVQMPDIIVKMGNADVASRHLFIWVFYSQYETWTEIARRSPSLHPPVLPPQITDIWIAAESFLGEDISKTIPQAVWQARRGTPWRVLGEAI